MTETIDIEKDTIAKCKLLYDNLMCWECNSGWHKILKRLSIELETLNLQFYDKFKVKICAMQVKEKYGKLRFYYVVKCVSYKLNASQDVIIEYLDNRAEELIKQAEEECSHTCEICGKRISSECSSACKISNYAAYICEKCAAKLKAEIH